MKKAGFLILNIIAGICIVLAAISIFTVMTTPKGRAPSVFGYSVMRVITDSMAPAVPEGSVMVVKNEDKYEIGEIISFYSSDPTILGKINSHRVSGVETDERGRILYTTRGDNNGTDDFYKVASSEIIGKMIYCSELLGVVVGLSVNPFIFFAIVVIPMLLVIFINVKRIVTLTRAEIEKEVNLEIELEKQRLMEAAQICENSVDQSTASDAEICADEARERNADRSECAQNADGQSK